MRQNRSKGRLQSARSMSCVDDDIPVHPEICPWGHI